MSVVSIILWCVGIACILSILYTAAVRRHKQRIKDYIDIVKLTTRMVAEQEKANDILCRLLQVMHPPSEWEPDCGEVVAEWLRVCDNVAILKSRVEHKLNQFNNKYD